MAETPKVDWKSLLLNAMAIGLTGLQMYLHYKSTNGPVTAAQNLPHKDKQ